MIDEIPHPQCTRSSSLSDEGNLHLTSRSYNQTLIICKLKCLILAIVIVNYWIGRFLSQKRKLIVYLTAII